MDENTIPIDLDERTRVLWQETFLLREHLARLAKTSWIQKQEFESLYYEVQALRLRILELEEKGLDDSQPRF